MATHSTMLAWEIPWTEEPGRLQSIRCNSPPERTCRDVRICGHMDIGLCNFNKTELGPHAM